jgi:site-specific DNA-methyltransferase (adenine-specific)
MTPFYETGRATLYLGDCLEVLENLPASSVDTLLTDPPYCSGGYLEAQKNTPAQGLRGATVRAGDFHWFTSDNMSTAGLTWLLRSVLFQAVRVLKPNRSALLFTDWRMVPHLAPALESSGLRYRNMLIWDKGNAGLGVGFKPSYEVVLEFCKGNPQYQVKTGQNVLRHHRVPASQKRHHAEKPVPLLVEILNVVTPPDGMVLDPFLGSGPTGVAALRNGFRFVGIEREADYCAIAAARLRAEESP